MTPADLLQWIIDNEATEGPVISEDGKVVSWYCSTRDMRVTIGKTLQDAVEMCRKAKEE